jgi:amino acid adenylation domain-containing protein
MSWLWSQLTPPHSSPRQKTELNESGATAESIAVRHGNLEITYAELESAAKSLAAELTRCGASQAAPVGVCITRSVDHVVALLGAFCAGAPFLPLDPDWPAARLKAVLDDAGARIVISDDAHLGEVAGGGRIVLSSADRPPKRASTPVPEQAIAAPDAVAYVIYTSGSTGAPKGVEITRANLASLIRWHLEAFGVTHKDRASWIGGLAFDASVWELFPALAAGAEIVIPPEGVRGSAETLRDWLIAEGVTIAFAPTPLAEPMMTADWPARTALRTLLTGGDVLHVRPRSALPYIVVNNYGLSECAVVSTSGAVAPDAVGLPTIGRPIAGTRVHILDASGRAVEKGEAGEIYIAGEGVGVGYRGRPDLTSERFVMVAPEGGVAERCYRTGDLGRWTPEGEIAFLGRRDDQIKQRGHRIEPHEISAALARHPLIAQSAVIADGEGADRQLIAYVVPASDQAPRGAELRGFLAETLPEYMLPNVYVRLTELPLTANGKLDKAALPSPTSANTLPSAPYRAPETPVQTRIASMVEELLKIDRVGLDDNFFLLGGHSLLGTQLVLRLRDAFWAELALRDLFEAQTIENLAMKVEEAVRAMVTSMSDEEVRRRLAHSELG